MCTPAYPDTLSVGRQLQHQKGTELVLIPQPTLGDANDPLVSTRRLKKEIGISRTDLCLQNWPRPKRLAAYWSCLILAGLANFCVTGLGPSFGLPYKLAYKPPLCGPCETNDLSQGGAYSKVIYYGRWSVRHTNFAPNLRQEGAYSEGGAYMLVYTVLMAVWRHILCIKADMGAFIAPTCLVHMCRLLAQPTIMLSEERDKDHGRHDISLQRYKSLIFIAYWCLSCPRPVKMAFYG